MFYKTIKCEDHKGRDQEINVSIEGYEGEIKPGEVVYFSVYTTTRYFFSPAEGGSWDNWDTLEWTIPFRFSHEALDLILEAEHEKLIDYPFGNIYHSTGGQECFVRVERQAGSCASTERAHYE